ncbi:MAG: hypothetical protein IPG72_09550 [Ardenticatenales bacterium]|nr:hypothetical protein [Ardenticatenales bacterium]
MKASIVQSETPMSSAAAGAFTSPHCAFLPKALPNPRLPGATPGRPTSRAVLPRMTSAAVSDGASSSSGHQPFSSLKSP